MLLFKKVFVITLIIAFSFCLIFSAFAFTGEAVSEQEVYLYDAEDPSVSYRLSDPDFFIYNQKTYETYHYYGEGDGYLGFDVASIDPNLAINPTLGAIYVAGTELGEYEPSPDIFYVFKFKIRIFTTELGRLVDWSMLFSRWNLDILFSTGVGGLQPVQSNTFTKVNTNPIALGDEFYYTIIPYNLNRPDRFVCDMRLYHIDNNTVSVSLAFRLLEGIPKFERICNFQLICNSKASEDSYIPLPEDDFDSFLTLENSVVSNSSNLGNSVTSVFKNGFTVESMYSLSSVRNIFNVFYEIPTLRYIVYFSLALGVTALILNVAPSVVSSFKVGR